MICKNCGSEIKDEAKFCPYCGTAAGYEEAVQTSFSDKTKASFETDSVRSAGYPDSASGSSAGNPYRGPEQAGAGKGLGIAGMILGIVTIVFSWNIFVSFFTGIIGIILSAVSMKKNKNGFASAGLAMSIIGLALSFLLILFGVALIWNNVIF